jgi:hypothetical protein
MKQEEKDAQLKDLKAQAYDALANVQAWEARLRSLNEEIAKVSNSPVSEE